MSRIATVGSVLLLILLMAASTIPVAAADPTATPTLRPLPPTPTLNYLYGRPTPTALPVLTGDTLASLNPSGLDAGPFADMTINIYHYLNRDHLLDLVGGGVLALLAVTFMVNFINKRTNHDE